MFAKAASSAASRPGTDRAVARTAGRPVEASQSQDESDESEPVMSELLTKWDTVGITPSQSYLV